MDALVLGFFIVISLFGIVIVYGAPYVPTLTADAERALDLLDLSPGQTLLELGSGDGKMLLLAADRGIKSIGYELNPILYSFSKIRTRNNELIEVKFGNIWKKEWPDIDGMYVFLLDRFMPRLDAKITHYYEGVSIKVVTNSFGFPDRKPKETLKNMDLYVFD